MRYLRPALLLAAGAAAVAQQHVPRGTATDVTNADVEATLAKTATAAVSDQAIRVVSIYFLSAAGQLSTNLIGVFASLIVIFTRKR
jgi:hypothetical protein